MEKHNVSLAGTGKDYIVAQARVVQSNLAVLNVQVPGIVGGNRPYGMAFRARVSKACAAFVSQNAAQPSLADTGRLYAAVQLRSRGLGIVNVQIEGTGDSGNRSYGFAEEASCDPKDSTLLASVQDTVTETLSASEDVAQAPEPTVFPGLAVSDLGGLRLKWINGFVAVSDGGVSIFIPDVTVDELIRR